jgi:hypothetical protein
MPCPALEILGTPDGNEATGVRYESPDGASHELSADCIVDSSGHGLLTLDFLKSKGYGTVKETTIGIDLRYSTAVFANCNSGADAKIILSLPKAPERVRGGILIEIEKGHFHVTISGRHETVPPAEKDAFLAYVQQLERPTIFNAIKNADCLGEIARFGLPESRWRHFGKLDRFPRKLFPLGDSIARFNPVWGQGMAVALNEVQLLRDMLQTESRQGCLNPTLSESFLVESEALIANPWEMSAVPDFAYPETRGERPSNLKSRLEHQVALRQLATRDRAVRELLAEVRHLLKPASLLSEPEFVRRVDQEFSQPQSLT